MRAVRVWPLVHKAEQLEKLVRTIGFNCTLVHLCGHVYVLACACMRECAYVCSCACLCARVCSCVCVRLCVCGCVFAVVFAVVCARFCPLCVLPLDARVFALMLRFIMIFTCFLFSKLQTLPSVTEGVAIECAVCAFHW